jgi:DNA-binding LytR/AlgR family response regulator
MAWIAQRTSFTDLPLFKTGALSLLPLILFNLISYNIMLRNKVVSVIDSGKQWFKEEKEGLLNHPQKKFRIVAENGKDVFEEKIENVLLIHSSGNYIKIFRTDNKDVVRKKLFRQSLANVERTLKDSEEFKKCHRSWMVNMNKISGLIGNSKGYSLNITGIDLSVPVSRNYFAIFKDRLS